MKLNLGCGKDIKKDYVNLDVVKMPGVDVVADIEGKLPFSDDTFDEIYGSHILEHVSNLAGLLREFIRISKNNSKIKIIVPHFSFFGSFTDPTHKRFFGYRTMDYFTENNELDYYTDLRFSMINKEIRFYFLKDSKRQIKNYPMNWFANAFPLFYERFLCWIIPAHEVYYELQPIKKKNG